MKKLLQVATLFLGLSGCATSPEAKQLVDVSVVNRTTGQHETIYRHHGKLYVAGKPGDRYAVSLRNRTGGRVLTVLSVDGINSISGETAGTNQAGYVLAPYDSADIAGWRKSQNDVAAFYFTAIPDSYAARTNRPDNVGVIGVAVFRERAELRMLNQPEESTREKKAADALGSATPEAAKKLEQRLGTGHGERVDSPVQYTAFKRDSSAPQQVIRIYYDSYANLVALGVIEGARRCPPNPFPASARFVPDP